MLVNKEEFIILTSQKILSGLAPATWTGRVPASHSMAEEAVDMAESLYKQLEKRGYLESDIIQK